MRPSARSTSVGSVSRYVERNLVSSRYSTTLSGSGWSSRSFSSTVAFVDQPVRFFFDFFVSSPSTSNRICPSCLGESMLKSSPASSMISARSSSMCPEISEEISLSTFVSRPVPKRSIDSSTGMSLSSISQYRFQESSSLSLAVSTSTRLSATAASNWPSLGAFWPVGLTRSKYFSASSLVR